MILVDRAVWAHRGDRWAHLVSDRSLDELHAFAATLGRRRFSFQGDHYDVPAEARRRALDLGAQAVDGRQLLASLRRAGLRLARAERPSPWHIVHDGPVIPCAARGVTGVPDRPGATELDPRLTVAMGRVGGRATRMLIGVRPGEQGALLAGPLPPEVPADLDVDALHLTAPPDEDPSVELFVWTTSR